MNLDSNVITGSFEKLKPVVSEVVDRELKRGERMSEIELVVEAKVSLNINDQSYDTIINTINSSEIELPQDYQNQIKEATRVLVADMITAEIEALVSSELKVIDLRDTSQVEKLLKHCRVG